MSFPSLFHLFSVSFLFVCFLFVCLFVMFDFVWFRFPYLAFNPICELYWPRWFQSPIITRKWLKASEQSGAPLDTSHQSGGITGDVTPEMHCPSIDCPSYNPITSWFDPISLQLRRIPIESLNASERWRSWFRSVVLNYISITFRAYQTVCGESERNVERKVRYVMSCRVVPRHILRWTLQEFQKFLKECHWVILPLSGWKQVYSISVDLLLCFVCFVCLPSLPTAAAHSYGAWLQFPSGYHFSAIIGIYCNSITLTSSLDCTFVPSQTLVLRR